MTIEGLCTIICTHLVQFYLRIVPFSGLTVHQQYGHRLRCQGRKGSKFILLPYLVQEDISHCALTQARYNNKTRLGLNRMHLFISNQRVFGVRLSSNNHVSQMAGRAANQDPALHDFGTVLIFERDVPSRLHFKNSLRAPKSRAGTRAGTRAASCCPSSVSHLDCR